jgi:hypothetical protein
MRFFTDAAEGMRLTSTGLGIGTSSPSVKLQAESSSSTSLTTLYLVNSSSAAVTTKQSSLSFRLTDSGSTRKNGFQLTAYSDSAGGNIENGGLIFTGRKADVDTEYARITSGGDVGIGTASPAAKLEVVAGTGAQLIGTFRTGDATAANNSGCGFEGVSSATAGSRAARMWLDADGANFAGGDYFYINKVGNSGDVNLIQQSNASMTFQTSGAERARIDSSGNLLVGTTTALGNGFAFQPNGSDTNVPLLSVNGNSSSNTLASFRLWSTSLSQNQFYVGYGGTIYARSTSITGLSDISEKENIRDLETGINTVLALQPRRFDWKNGSGENVAGFIAQEVQSVLPDLVESYKVSEDETKLGLKMGDMIPTLVKAIQEQQALIQSLKARLDAANL